MDKKYIEYLKRNPAAFIEDIMDVKLTTYQKMYISALSKKDKFVSPNRSGRMFTNYISLCIKHMLMDDNEKILLWEYKEQPKEMNKTEFGLWLNEYADKWKLKVNQF